MTQRYLSDKNPDGTTLGQSAADLIGFHGATPSDQRAFTSTITTTILSSTSGEIWGFGTSDAGEAVVSAVNEIINLLIEKGLMAAS